MTAPAKILLATSNADHERAWSEALATARCEVLRLSDHAPIRDVDVVITDRSITESGVALDEERLARGQIGLVAVGLGLPADVSLPTDCSPRELRLACLLLSEIVRLRRQREAFRRKEKVLSHLAMSDPLTGLPNRRAWELHLSERLTGEGDPSPCCLAMLDIDLFKDLNDYAGHLAGDDCLKGVAARLTTAARRRNAVARVGGDEFAILLEGVEPSEAASIVDRIRIQAGGGESVSGNGRSLTLSAGWASTTAPSSKTAIQVALRVADEALREAKKSGRNRTCPAPGAGS